MKHFNKESLTDSFYWFIRHLKLHSSEDLQTFIKDTLSNTHNALKINENETKNNLPKKERDMLNLLANNKNILIKPNDKCGKIVVMDTDHYEKACLDIFTNTKYYEELSYDPNDHYKQLIVKEIDQLRPMDYITDFEHSTLNEGDHTPLFYGLPKLHTVFFLFRPICSGSNSYQKIIRMD